MPALWRAPATNVFFAYKEQGDHFFFFLESKSNSIGREILWSSGQGSFAKQIQTQVAQSFVQLCFENTQQ